MNIIKVRTAELVPYQNNVRKHPDTQIDEMVRSLKAYGQTRAFVIDEENNVLVGNCMLMAMRKMGMEEADAHVIKGFDEKQKAKLVLSDNKIYKLGVDDYEAIERMLTEFANADNFDVAGYDENIIRELKTEMDDFEKQFEESMSKPISRASKPVEQGQEIPKGTRETAEKVERGEDIIDQGDFSEERTGEGESAGYGWSGQSDKRRSIICPNCGEVIYIDD